MILFRPSSEVKNGCEISFEALENDAVCGGCHMTFSPEKAVIDSLLYDNDKPYLVEGLIRSAFNYAASKNIYMGYCKCENITHFLENMNFEKQNGVYCNDIPSILQGKCCKKCDNI